MLYAFRQVNEAVLLRGPDDLKYGMVAIKENRHRSQKISRKCDFRNK